ncbi:MAG: M28 family peptidase [Proteobacteria bacterium]|nr:M28 family peptidase [Pseudomonadota bacterium]
MISEFRTPFLVSLLAVSACGASENDAPESGGEATNASTLNLITRDSIEAHLVYLADDAREGRMTGQPGHEAAARYVADRFAELDMEPAGENGWYQQVPLISYRIDTESTSVIAHRDGEDTELVYREDYGMYGDKVRSANSVRGQVVYVGYGTHAPDLGYSDYEGIDVEGKIVALFRGAPATFPHNERAFYTSSRTKAQEAVARGAIGVVILRSRHSQKNMSWVRYKKLIGTRPGMAWVNLSGEAADYFPQLLGTVTISAATATKLFAGTPIAFADALDAIEASRPSSTPLGLEMTLSRNTLHEQITSPNVIGVVRGSDPVLADEYVVFSGHLDGLGRGVAEDGDDIYNGAYDNAMGIALMLEAARVFAAAPPRRSIMFIAVTGEERGLLGSDYFAHYPTVPTDALVANVNLDMPLFLYPVADLIAFGSEHSSLEAVVAEAAVAEGFVLSPDPLPEETLFVRSDQYSFVRKGVPSAFLVPGFTSSDPNIDGASLWRDHLKNYYHRPSDDLSRSIDWDSAVRFARANARIGYLIADADDRPAWNEGDFFAIKFAGGQ